MHHKKFFSLIAVALASIGPVAVASAQTVFAGADDTIRIIGQDGTPKNIGAHVVVFAFKDGVTMRSRENVLRRYNLTLDPIGTGAHFVRAFLSPLEIAAGVTSVQKIEQMQRDPLLRYVEHDVLMEREQIFPTDPNFNVQFALHNTGQSGGLIDADVDAPEGWALTSPTATPIVVAVCDDGVPYTHPDLAANIWTNPGEVASDGIDNDGNGFIDDTRGWDFAAGDNDPMPASGNNHGAHCAGIIGMVHNNGVGGAGVVQRVRLMPMKITGGSVAWMTALANSVDYASLNGARVISVSYNIDGYTTALRDAVGRAGSRNVVYVNSAGNNAQNIDSLRGTLRNIHNNVIFVASTDRSDQLSSFSNFGTTVDIAAAGSDIYSTLLSGYGNLSGTSMSTPLVAGIIATIRQQFPALTARQALDRAISTAVPTPALTGRISGGRANLSAALDTDSIPPSAPSGFTVLRRSNTTARFSFVASGDDGNTGAASGYDFRVSTSPITAANFASARQIAVNVFGVAGGTTVQSSLSGLLPGTTYHVAARSVDNVGNLSPIALFGTIRTAAAQWLDDVDTSPQWTSTTGWTRVSTTASSGTQSWHDSPGGAYANNANTWMDLTNPVTLPANPMLRFMANFSLEATFDFMHVEISTDNGTTWRRVGLYTGSSGGWRSVGISLREFANQSVRIRFRLTSDSSITADGIFLDDIAILNGQTVWFDNANGAPFFTATPAGTTWAQTSVNSFSGPTSWSDSPTGSMPTNANWRLNGVVPIDTTQVGAPIMFFNMNMRVLRTHRIIATNSTDGTNWSGASEWMGDHNAWGTYSADVPTSTSTRIGFQMTTNATAALDGVFIDDIGVMGERFINTLSGSVTQQGITGTMRPVTLVVTPGAGSPETLALGSTSSFSVDVAASGAASLRFSAPGMLNRVVSGVTINANTVLSSPVVLISGDANQDQIIDGGDVNAVLSRFGAEQGDASYTESADANADGIIDGGDINVILAHFGMEGE